MILTKIKDSITAFNLPFNYGTPTELDKLVAESILPAVFMARLGQTTRVRVGAMICEQANVTLFFITKDNYGSNSEKTETDSITDMQALSEQWIKSINEGSTLKISNIKYDRVHLGGVKVYSGIGINCTIRETFGTCINDISYGD
jgi:hypothetical protein